MYLVRVQTSTREVVPSVVDTIFVDVFCEHLYLFPRTSFDQVPVTFPLLRSSIYILLEVNNRCISVKCYYYVIVMQKNSLAKL